jgi:DNA repair exonuclease SbcCD nuclease subunit
MALGHHHNFKEFRYGATAVYPGTLEGLKFGENGDRYLIVADVRESGVTVEKCAFNQKLLKEVEINPALEGLTCCETLEAAIRNHSGGGSIVKVTMKGSCDFLPARAELEAKLAGDFFHLQIEDEISVFDSELIRRAKNDRTVQGIFIRKMLRKMEQASPEQRASLELALRLTVEQFQEAHHATDRA